MVALEGASAAGKTTVASTVTRALGWTFIPEAYRRLRPSPSLEFRSAEELLALELRLLEEDGRRFVDARAHARSGTSVLVDTGFLGALTYTLALVGTGTAPPSVLSALVEVARALSLRGEWGLADAYLYLDTLPGTRSARSRADPAGHPPELAPRHARVGAAERRFYLERFAPLLGSRFQSIAGGGTRGDLADRVSDVVRSMPRPLPSEDPVAEVLRLFDNRLLERGRPRGE